MSDIKTVSERLGVARKQKHDLMNERKPLLDELDQLANKSNFSNTDDRRFKQVKEKIIQLNRKISTQDEVINETTDELVELGGNPNWHEEEPPIGVGMGFGSRRESKNVEIWESVSGSNKGQEIKVLNNRASLADELGQYPQSPDMNWQNYMRSRIAGHTGNYSIQGPQFKNQMSTTSDSALVPTPLSARVIDLARNKSRIFQAGAMTVPMESKTLTIARVTGDATPAWKAENASMTSSDVSTESVQFTAKTLVASVKMSVELSEDAPNGSSVIENSISNQLALELDRVALVGSGVDPEPQGIFGATNVQEVDLGTDGAALTNYDNYSTAYQKVLEANGEPNAVIHAPRTWGTLDRLKDANNQPLTPPMSFQNLAKYQTNQVPIDLTKGASTDASLAFIGAWMNLMVGVRTDIRIEITRVASDSTNSAWEDLQVWIRAYLRADIQLAHPDHFCVIDGITP